MSKEEVEQLLVLKDGREIFKTHNGFKSFVKSKKGEITEVTSQYYEQAKVHRVKKIKILKNYGRNS